MLRRAKQTKRQIIESLNRRILGEQTTLPLIGKEIEKVFRLIELGKLDDKKAINYIFKLKKKYPNDDLLNGLIDHYTDKGDIKSVKYNKTGDIKSVKYDLNGKIYKVKT